MLSLGGAPTDDFRIEGLPASAMTIEVVDDKAFLCQPGHEWSLAPDSSYDVAGGELRIVLYGGSPIQPQKGMCPRCGGGLRRQTLGGAYRSVAQEERICGRCQTSVVAFRAAARTVGLFSAARRTEWVHVTASMKCPECLRPMELQVFRTTAGEAEVERCHRCGLVVFSAEDRRTLSGDGSRAK